MNLSEAHENSPNKKDFDLSLKPMNADQYFQEVWSRTSSIHLMLEDVIDFINYNQSELGQRHKNNLSREGYDNLLNCLECKITDLIELGSSSGELQKVAISHISSLSLLNWHTLLNKLLQTSLALDQDNSDHLNNLGASQKSGIPELPSYCFEILTFKLLRLGHSTEHPIYKLSTGSMNKRMQSYFKELHRLDPEEVKKLHMSSRHVEVNERSTKKEFIAAERSFCIDYLMERRKCFEKVSLDEIVLAWKKFITGLSEVNKLLDEETYLTVARVHPDCSILFMKLRFGKIAEAAFD